MRLGPVQAAGFKTKFIGQAEMATEAGYLPGPEFHSRRRFPLESPNPWPVLNIAESAVSSMTADLSDQINGCRRELFDLALPAGHPPSGSTRTAFKKSRHQAGPAAGRCRRSGKRSALTAS